MSLAVDQDELYGGFFADGPAPASGGGNAG
jgi:hypothetical protein